MLLPNFFSLLWNDRGVQIEAGGKADATQDQSEADMSTLGSSVSDPDLRASLSSTSDSLTLQDPGSSGMQTTSFQTIPLTILSRNVGSYYDRIRSFFSRMVHPVEESPDVFSSLKSVAEGLSAILKHCDVRLSLLHHSTDYAHGRPANHVVLPTDRIIDTSSRTVGGIAHRTCS